MLLLISTISSLGSSTFDQIKSEIKDILDDIYDSSKFEKAGGYIYCSSSDPIYCYQITQIYNQIPDEDESVEFSQVKISFNCQKTIKLNYEPKEIFIIKLLVSHEITESKEPGNHKLGIDKITDTYYKFILLKTGNTFDTTTSINIKDICKEDVIIYSPLDLNSNSEMKSKWKEIYDQNPYSNKLKYDYFYPKASIYSDVCTPLTNTIITGKSGNKVSVTKTLDMSVFQRKTILFPGEIEICPSGCDYIGLDGDTMSAKCQCTFNETDLISTSSTDLKSLVYVKIEYDEKKFKNKNKDNYFSIDVLKCIYLPFRKDSIRKNIGCIIIFILAGVIFLSYFFLVVTGKYQLLSVLELLYNSNINSMNYIKNPNSNLNNNSNNNNNFQNNLGNMNVTKFGNSTLNNNAFDSRSNNNLLLGNNTYRLSKSNNGLPFISPNTTNFSNINYNNPNANTIQVAKLPNNNLQKEKQNKVEAVKENDIESSNNNTQLVDNSSCINNNNNNNLNNSDTLPVTNQPQSKEASSNNNNNNQQIPVEQSNEEEESEEESESENENENGNKNPAPANPPKKKKKPIEIALNVNDLKNMMFKNNPELLNPNNNQNNNNQNNNPQNQNNNNDPNNPLNPNNLLPSIANLANSMKIAEENLRKEYEDRARQRDLEYQKELEKLKEKDRQRERDRQRDLEDRRERERKEQRDREEEYKNRQRQQEYENMQRQYERERQYDRERQRDFYEQMRRGDGYYQNYPRNENNDREKKLMEEELKLEKKKLETEYENLRKEKEKLKNEFEEKAKMEKEKGEVKQKELEELKDQNRQKELDYEKELIKQKDKLKEEYENKLKELKEAKDKEIEDLKAQKNTEIENLRLQKEKEIDSLKNQMNNQKLSMEEQNKLREKEFKKEKKRLKDMNKNLTNSSMLMNGFINSLNANATMQQPINIENLDDTKEFKPQIVTSIESIFADAELNAMDFENSCKFDKRTLCQYYYSILNLKQPLFYLFNYGSPSGSNVTTFHISYKSVKFIVFSIEIMIYFFFNQTVFGSKTVTWKYNGQLSFRKRFIFGLILCPFCMILSSLVQFFTYNKVNEKIADIKLRCYSNFVNKMNMEEKVNNEFMDFWESDEGKNEKPGPESNQKNEEIADIQEIENQNIPEEEKAKRKSKYEKRKLKMQIQEVISIMKKKILYSFLIVIVILFIEWYYITAFCTVYKNTQEDFFLNVLMTFAISNIVPFIYAFFPTIIREDGIKNKKKFIFKISRVLQMI